MGIKIDEVTRLRALITSNTQNASKVCVQLSYVSIYLIIRLVRNLRFNVRKPSSETSHYVAAVSSW